MKVAKKFIEEALSKTKGLIRTTGQREVTYENLKEIFSSLKEKNPYVADFINQAAVEWVKNPHSNRYEQAGLLWVYLVALTDAFGKQEEVNKLEILWRK